MRARPPRAQAPSPPESPAKRAQPARSRRAKLEPVPLPARLTNGARPLHGRVALVTGGGRGIGRAVAAALGAAGAAVVVAARTQRELESAAREVERLGARALAVPCDVCDVAQVEALVARAVRHFKRLDILVNAAGTFLMAPVEATDEALWDAVVDSNLKGTFLVTRAALPHLRRRRGQVVNIVSVAGRTPFPGNAAYCAAKHGVLGFTSVLREEERANLVRVTAVLPGATDTPLWDRVPGTWERKRMLKPEVVARLVVHVCRQPPGASTDEVVVAPVRGPQ